MEFALNKYVDDLLVSCSANTTLGEHALLLVLVLGTPLDVVRDSVLDVVPVLTNGEHAIARLGGVPALALGGGVLVADSGLDGGAVDGNKHDSSFLFGCAPLGAFRLTGTTIDPFSVWGKRFVLSIESSQLISARVSLSKLVNFFKMTKHINLVGCRVLYPYWFGRFYNPTPLIGL